MCYNIIANWTEVDRFPNYLISNNGSIFSKRYNKIMKHCIKNSGYHQIGLRNNNGLKYFTIHRLVYENFGENWDETLQVDHVDHNQDNNCIQNLRMATGQQQQFNRGIFKNNELGVKNIKFRKGKFISRIQVNGKRIYIGFFDTLGEAQLAYDLKAKELHKEFFNKT